MLEYITQIGPLKVKHVLFANRIVFLDFFKFVNYSYMRKRVYNPLFIVAKRQTRLIDLTQPFEQIFQDFGFYNRRNIRRASKNNLKFSIVTDVKEFVDFYNAFAERKHLKLQKQKCLEKIPNFTITKITKDGKTLAMHLFLTDKDINLVRGFYGASVRLDNSADTKLASLANRYLHFKELEYFKENGFAIYDWGGTAEHTKKKTNHRIDEFKKQFGGYIVDEYQYESIPLYIAIKLKHLFFHRYPY